MKTKPFFNRALLVVSALFLASQANALVNTVNPSTALTPVTRTTSVNFTYTPAAGSVSEQSTEVFLCTTVPAFQQGGGAFPSGPTPLTPSSFCSNTQAPAPGAGTLNLAGAAAGGETFTMTPAAFTGLYDGVGGYATVYFVRSWFDNSLLQSYTVSRLQLIPTLTAAPDTLSVIGGNSADVLANDFIEVLNASATNVVLSIVNNGGIAGLSVVGAQLLVPATTNGGSYNVTYRICDAAPGGAANCVNGAATLNVTAASLPQADTATVPSSATTNVNVLSNDRIGSTVATVANANITLVAPLAIAGLTINGTGQIVVPPAAPGAYVVNYRLCNAAAPAECGNAALSLTVSVPLPAANADSITLPVTGGQVAVLGNDTIDGIAATAANVLTTIQNSGGMVGLTVNAAGAIVVPANASGVYTVAYRICALSAPAACANSTATITLAPTLVAGNDSATLTSTAGGAVVVIGNDTVDGAAATVANVLVTVAASGGLTGVAPNAAGALVVPAFAAGVYPVTYRICSIAVPTTCTTAVATISMSPTLVANNDSANLTTLGGTVAVLGNDTVDGAAATISNVAVSIVANGGLTGVSVNAATGALAVPSFTAGVYAVNYRICSTVIVTTCSTAIANITLATAFALAGDSASLPASGGTVTVLANDTINGVAATIGNAILTVVNNGGLTGLSVTAGALTVTTNPAGAYVVIYRVCDVLSPTSCANATASITIAAPIVVANNDAVSLPASGGIVNVLGNDSIGGQLATLSNVTVSIIASGGLAGLSVDATGALVVPANASGTYTLTYRICDRITVTNCANASVLVTLGAVVVMVIAGSDSGTVSTTSGGSIAVMSNDSIGGSPATVANSTRSVLGNGGIPGLSFNPATGQLSVPAFVAGEYTARYRLCAAAAPTSCADANVFITMLPTLTALADSYTLPSAGGVATVLDNDRVDAGAATSSNVAVTVVSNGGLNSITVTGTGSLLIPAAAAGRYDVTYRICSLAVSTACATTIASIAVTPSISAVPDTAILPNVGGDVDVLANDSVSGVAATALNVLLTITNPDRLNGLSISSTAKIRVPANNAPGSYAPTYRICSTGAAPVCASSTASITIGVPMVAAQPETAALPSTGGRVAVLDNDTYNGGPATSLNVTTTITNAGGLVGLLVDASGAIVVPASASGSYSVAYRICALPPSASTCADAVATVVVSAPVILLVADRLVIADSGGVLAVLANDLIAGAPATAANAIVSIINNGGLTSLAVNASGELVVPATEGGSYSVSYRVCARAAPATCAVSSVVVTVNTSTLVIKLVDDVVVSGQLGSTFNVLSNDTVATRAVVDSAVTLALVNNGGLPTLALAATGVLTIPPTTTGVYVATYRLCQKNLAANCAEAKVRITVTQGQGIGEVARRRPPSVPGAATATYTLTPGSNAPIIFSQPVPASAGAANSPLILGETRLGYGATAAAGRFQSYRSDSALEPFGAQFQYSGTGTLNYRWEVVRPGEPEPELIDLYPEQSLSLADRLRQTRYSEISRGQVFLPAMGRYFLRGPDPALLPRTNEGNYLILLRIEASTASVSGALNGATAFPIQPLTYVMVGDRGISTTPPDPRNPDALAAAARGRLSGGSSVAEFSNMGQLPDAGPRLNSGALRFRSIGDQWQSLRPKVIEIIGATSQAGKPISLSWKPVADVAMYRIVIESLGAGSPSVVIVVKPGSESGHPLKASILESLSTSTGTASLRWQVQAFAADGKIIAIGDWSLLKR